VSGIPKPILPQDLPAWERALLAEVLGLLERLTPLGRLEARRLVNLVVDLDLWLEEQALEDGKEVGYAS